MFSLVTLKDSYYNNGMDRADDLKYTRVKKKKQRGERRCAQKNSKFYLTLH